MKTRWCDYHEVYEPIDYFYPSPYYDGISMICRKAKEVGLTNIHRKPWLKYTDDELKSFFEEYKNATNLKQFCKSKNWQ